jgi:hypothetical protein
VVRYRKAKFLLLAAVLGVGVIFGISRVRADGAPEQAYQRIGRDLEPFRADFNAVSDHVRVVLLVGPT